MREEYAKEDFREKIKKPWNASEERDTERTKRHWSYMTPAEITEKATTSPGTFGYHTTFWNKTRWMLNAKTYCPSQDFVWKREKNICSWAIFKPNPYATARHFVTKEFLSETITGTQVSLHAISSLTYPTLIRKIFSPRAASWILRKEKDGTLKMTWYANEGGGSIHSPWFYAGFLVILHWTTSFLKKYPEAPQWDKHHSEMINNPRDHFPMIKIPLLAKYKQHLYNNTDFVEEQTADTQGCAQFKRYVNLTLNLLKLPCFGFEEGKVDFSAGDYERVMGTPVFLPKYLWNTKDEATQLVINGNRAFQAKEQNRIEYEGKKKKNQQEMQEFEDDLKKLENINTKEKKKPTQTRNYDP